MAKLNATKFLHSKNAKLKCSEIENVMFYSITL